MIGNATFNAELWHTGTGKPVSNIRLATNRVVNGQETTQFHSVVCWDKLAEITSQYVKKGEPIYGEGRLEYRTFEDGDGFERGDVKIVANDVQFLGRRRERSAKMIHVYSHLVRKRPRQKRSVSEISIDWGQLFGLISFPARRCHAMLGSLFQK